MQKTGDQNILPWKPPGGRRKDKTTAMKCICVNWDNWWQHYAILYFLPHWHHYLHICKPLNIIKSMIVRIFVNLLSSVFAPVKILGTTLMAQNEFIQTFVSKCYNISTTKYIVNRNLPNFCIHIKLKQCLAGQRDTKADTKNVTGYHEYTKDQSLNTCNEDIPTVGHGHFCIFKGNENCNLNIFWTRTT